MDYKNYVLRKQNKKINNKTYICHICEKYSNPQNYSNNSTDSDLFFYQD